MPFFICITFLIIAYVYRLASFNQGKDWQMQTDLVATLMSILSISLLSYTVGVHRVPLNLWHQHNDGSAHIVTYGPYERIRHPFYTSFILALFGALVYFVHVATLSAFLYGLIAMNITATMEERKLSQHDDQYRDYIRKTGRFLPNLLADKSKVTESSHGKAQEK